MSCLHCISRFEPLYGIGGEVAVLNKAFEVALLIAKLCGMSYLDKDSPYKGGVPLVRLSEAMPYGWKTVIRRRHFLSPSPIS